MKNGLEIRMDDVLQTKGITRHQIKYMNTGNAFELFLEIDKEFEKYNYPCTLAICAKGISFYPEWVKHIQNNIQRYNIQLHCLTHRNYLFADHETTVRELKEALDLIEQAFGVRPTIWYPPKGRRGEPNDKDEICKELGIKCFQQFGKTDARLWLSKPANYPHINFHYWHPSQCEYVREILKRCQKSEPNSKNG